MSHTPGPWKIDEASGARWHEKQFGSGDYRIVTVESGLRPSLAMVYQEANAHLIAAAPELLAACKAAKQHLIRDLAEPGRTVFWQLVSAIAKAEGRDIHADANV